MAVNGRFYLMLGGELANLGAIAWGFRAPATAYDNIGSGLGVTKLQDNDTKGVLYGVSQPRPARVRLAYNKGNGSTEGKTSGSAIRFCDPDRLNNVLFGSINGLKVKVRSTEYNIDNVTLKGAST